MSNADATLAEGGAPAVARAAPAPRAYISSRGYDALFYIASPLLALVLGVVVMGGWFTPFDGVRTFGVGAFITVWTFAHLIAVVFRSHLNPDIFHLHRGRFVVVPLVVAAGLWVSDWLLVFGVALGLFWDVYHTAMQNFGFCRLYDMRAGNAPEAGRRLDWWLNIFIYIGPILVGPSLRSHVKVFEGFERVEWNLPLSFGEQVLAYQEPLASLVLLAAGGFLVIYVYRYWEMTREGYRLSPQKLALIGSTAVASIYAWAVLPAVEAFFVTNFYHGLQYFAIVWWSERKTITRRTRARGVVALLVFVVPITAFGVAYHLWGGSYDEPFLRLLGVAFLTVSLMHFWYDGFIWSVRKKQV